MINKPKVRMWMNTHYEEFIDPLTGDVNMTTMAEACAQHFGVASDDGDTEEEDEIFFCASEFFEP